MPDTLRYPVVLMDADETLLDFKKSEDFAIKNAMKEFRLPFKKGDEKLYSRMNSLKLCVSAAFLKLWDMILKWTATNFITVM